MLFVEHQIWPNWTVFMSLNLRDDFVASLVMWISSRWVEHLLEVLPVWSLDSRLSCVVSTSVSMVPGWPSELITRWWRLCGIVCELPINIEILKQAESHHFFSLVGWWNNKVVIAMMALLLRARKHYQRPFWWDRLGLSLSKQRWPFQSVHGVLLSRWCPICFTLWWPVPLCVYGKMVRLPWSFSWCLLNPGWLQGFLRILVGFVVNIILLRWSCPLFNRLSFPFDVWNLLLIASIWMFNCMRVVVHI